MKVLIAEDDENIRNGLIDILEGEGYAELALSGVHAGEVDSIVIDRLRIDANAIDEGLVSIIDKPQYPLDCPAQVHGGRARLQQGCGRRGYTTRCWIF